MKFFKKLGERLESIDSINDIATAINNITIVIQHLMQAVENLAKTVEQHNDVLSRLAEHCDYDDILDKSLLGSPKQPN